jgi:hypothetical protein
MINVSAIPQGNDITLLVEATGYASRVYVFDIIITGNYYITVYLSQIITPPAKNDSELYICTVINDVGQTISDVHVIIKGLINETNYEIVSEMYTDGNGRFSVWLLPGKLYKVILTKDTYQNASADYIPQPPDLYGQTIGGVFKMYLEQWEPQPPLSEPDYIHFTGIRRNTTLYVNYTDDLSKTINTTIYIYEIAPGGLETLLFTFSNTSENTIRLTISTINKSRDHEAILYYRHTTFGNQSHMAFMSLETPISIMPAALRPMNKLNNFLVILIGYNPFGWANFLMFFFLVAGFYYMDEKYAGVMMAFMGGIFLMLNIVFGFDSTLFTLAGGAVPALFLIIGVMYEWVKHKQKVSW